MATSNRDRIGRMFDVLAGALEPFIARVVSPGLAPGADWSQLIALKDKRPEQTDRYSRTDPLMQLRMLSENITSVAKTGWYPFNAHLTRAQQAYATELRDVRNSWAHGDAFSNDDTYRALDTAERLLRAVDATEAADQVADIRQDVRRVAVDRDDRRAAATTVVHAESSGLPAWRDVLQPHEDVASGNFRAAEFAADLSRVASDDTSLDSEYRDPVSFFARTYVTTGLRDLVKWAVDRLTGNKNAPPVINLQTNFGGGKTHSMLALWHLTAGLKLSDYPQAMQEALADTAYPPSGKLGARRVALVGHQLPVSGAEKPDGTYVNTMWGELAWQLGGRAAYDIVAESDRTRTSPGAALGTLLSAYAPCLILIDEWVAYARELYADNTLAAGTFDTQFTFAQLLTETAKNTPGVLVAISIPASDRGDDGDATSTGEAIGSEEEVGGAHGREALRRLQNVVRRIADQWRPASATESYEIVRRRLFVEPDAAALTTIKQVAKQFREFYSAAAGEFPRDARETEYEDRIRRAYPIHPELFERLYEDWSTLERFQRTRGVLRLMNAVIHELWVAGDQSPLIMPGSIPLAAPAVNAELTQYLPDSWRAIIDTDVDGPESAPLAIDKEKRVLGQRSLTQRLARTIFFGAAPTIGSEHTGLERQRVFIGTAVPGDTIGNYHSALTNLADHTTYFYSANGRYWYDTHPNITRRAKDAAERLHQEDVWGAIEKLLEETRSPRGSFVAVSVASEPADVPDHDELRLVYVHPRYAHKRDDDASATMQFASRTTEKRGTGNRHYRNMVVFLAADETRLQELETVVRESLAWAAILSNSRELGLSGQQEDQARSQQARADQTMRERLPATYMWALVPAQPDPTAPFTMSAIKAEGSGALAERAWRKLHEKSQVADELSVSHVRFDLDGALSTRWAGGHVRFGDLWDDYATYPYLRRLRSRDVLAAAVRRMSEQLTWQGNGIAVAQSYDEATDTYRGLILPSDTYDQVRDVPDDLLVVRPERAVAQRAREAEAAGLAAVPATSGGSTPTVTTGYAGGVGSPGAEGATSTFEESPRIRRFFGTKELSSDRYAVDWRKIVDEVVVHLASVHGGTVQIRLDIEADAPDGFPDDVVRTVSENANTLKFEQSGFEES